MDSKDPAALELEQWVRMWRKTGAALESIKRAELERLNTATAVTQLSEAFDAALRSAPSRLTSGLVEQQRIYHKLRA
jgi:hypothetical protein